jgi:hypothetical protein
VTAGIDVETPLRPTDPWYVGQPGEPAGVAVGEDDVDEGGAAAAVVGVVVGMPPPLLPLQALSPTVSAATAVRTSGRRDRRTHMASSVGTHLHRPPLGCAPANAGSLTCRCSEPYSRLKVKPLIEEP